MMGALLSPGRGGARARRAYADRARRALAKWLGPAGADRFRPTATFVGNNRLLVGTQVGPYTIAYYVEADDRLLTPWFSVTGQYETNLTNYFLRSVKPDSHCLDIGTNFGFFTCLMARLCRDGRVIGVEADDRLATLARDNLFINGLYGAADVLCAAASDKAGALTLYRRTSRSGNTSIVRMDEAFTTLLGEPPVEPFTVASFSIDDLADRFDRRVDFIKVDVEGAEPLVLAGAAETIRRNPDIAIVMEWSPGQIASAGFDLRRFAQDIAALGLHCFMIDEHAVRPIAGNSLADLPYQAGILLRRADRAPQH